MKLCDCYQDCKRFVNGPVQNGKPSILEKVMRFSVDAHAIGQHLTGNETYIRNLLNCFEVLDREADFVAYISREEAVADLPQRFQKRRVSVNPFVRLGYDLPRRVAEDRPSLLHVQYTAPHRLLGAYRGQRA